MRILKLCIMLGLVLVLSVPVWAIPVRVQSENREQGNLFITIAAAAGTYNRILVAGVPEWELSTSPGTYLPHTSGSQVWNNAEDGWGLIWLNDMRLDNDNNGSYETVVYNGPTDASGGLAYIGMFWGVKDDVVVVNANKTYDVSSSGVKFEMWAVTLPKSINTYYIENVDLTADTRSAQNVLNTWPMGSGTLVLSGTADSFNFSGSLLATSGGGFGSSDVFISVNTGAGQGIWGPSWDTNTQLGSDLYLNWTVANVFENNSLVSSDFGYGDVIPEPVTLLGVFIGVAGLGNYLRKRRVA